MEFDPEGQIACGVKLNHAECETGWDLPCKEPRHGPKSAAVDIARNKPPFAHGGRKLTGFDSRRSAEVEDVLVRLGCHELGDKLRGFVLMNYQTVSPGLRGV